MSIFERLSEEQRHEAASKADVRESELRLQAHIKETELRLQTHLKETELRLLKWQFGIGIVLVSIMAKGFGWLGF